jgi:AAA family ATP:ADP antiporter
VKWLVPVEQGELRALVLSFAYFFFLLASFSVLRPVRDAMAAASGVDNLPWLFTGTFVTMLVVAPLFALLTRRFPRRVFLPVTYRVFAAMMLAFYGLLATETHPEETAAAFYVWVSVYNVFVVSVFWSFMADVFDTAQARRLFGTIATGGTAGMIAGPTFTSLLADNLGAAPLLLITAVLLELAVWCVYGLDRWARGRPAHAHGDQPVAGSVLQGFWMVVRSPFLLGIAVHVFLYSLTSTFLYAEQQRMVEEATRDTGERVVIFSQIDLYTQLATLGLQALVTGRLLRHLGVAVALGTLPVITAIGSGWLAGMATLPVLILFQAARRATQYGIERPGRESLFAAAGRDVKYRTKNFMDTVVFRGGDWVTIWLHSGLASLGLGVVAFATLLVPLSIGWTGLTTWLGSAHNKQVRPS